MKIMLISAGIALALTTAADAQDPRSVANLICHDDADVFARIKADCVPTDDGMTVIFKGSVESQAVLDGTCNINLNKLLNIWHLRQFVLRVTTRNYAATCSHQE